MSELGSDARSIVDAALGGDEPGQADRARVRAGVMRRIGVGVAAATTATATATAAAGSAAGGTVVASAGGLGAIGKAIVVLGIIGIVGGGGAYAVHVATQPTPRSNDVAAHTAPMIVASAPVGSGERASIPSLPASSVAIASVDTAAGPSASGAAPKIAAAAAPSKSSSTLEAELALLQDAQAALHAGDDARALALLDRHAALYPNGALAEERAGARVLALCGLGREGARGEAERFMSQRPSSPLIARIKGACGLE